MFVLCIQKLSLPHFSLRLISSYSVFVGSFVVSLHLKETYFVLAFQWLATVHRVNTLEKNHATILHTNIFSRFPFLWVPLSSMCVPVTFNNRANTKYTTLISVWPWNWQSRDKSEKCRLQIKRNINKAKENYMYKWLWGKSFVSKRITSERKIWAKHCVWKLHTFVMRMIWD